MFAQRLELVQAKLATGEGLLFSQPYDVQYLSGFQFLVPEEREALLLVTSQHAHLFYSSFSPLDLPRYITPHAGCGLKKLREHTLHICQTESIKQLQVDKSNLHVDEFEQLASIPHLKLETLDKKRLGQLRQIKDASEVESLRKAAQIAQQAFAVVQPQLKVGITELEVMDLLDTAMKKAGSSRPAFPTIVCFGAHAAQPHHQPTTTALTPETPVLLDFGATVAGYRSDMTRSWWFGTQPSETYQTVANLVQQAYQAALTLLTARPSAPPTSADLDKAAREVITQGGYGAQFIHTTGHGIGLDIHEEPSLSWYEPQTIQPGMVITIEPGIYLDQSLGYRYENTILVTQDGAEELTKGERE